MSSPQRHAEPTAPVGTRSNEHSAGCPGSAHRSQLGGLYVLSRDTFRVVGLGGLRPRPKHTRYEAPLDGLVFHHCDAEGGTGMRFRCWIVDLPDGRWIADSTALERKGEATPFAEDADGFLTALGDQARSLAR
jgi:hypothetical protein